MIALALALLAFDTSPPVQAPPRITKRAWADFKPGSFARYKLDQRAGGSAYEMDYKMTLAEVGDAKCSLDYEMTFNGNTTRSRMDVPHGQIGPFGGAAQSKELSSGHETLTVAGKRLRCVWKTYETDMGAQKYTSKVWMCNDVPGLTVKTMMDGPNMNYTMELTEWEIAK